MELGVIEYLKVLILQYPLIGYVLSGLGLLVVMGRIYVAMTPNKDDDAKYAKLEAIPLLGVVFKVLASFSYVQRKEPEIKLESEIK